MGKRLIIIGANFSSGGNFGGSVDTPNPGGNTPSGGNNTGGDTPQTPSSGLPSGYTLLSYIEADQAYIDTGYTYTGGDYRLLIKYDRLDSGAKLIFGAHDGDNRTMLLGYWTDPSNRNVFATGSSGLPDGLTVADSSVTTLDIDLQSVSDTVSGSCNGTPFETRTFETAGHNSTLSLAVFTKSGNKAAEQTMHAKLYKLKLTVGGTVVMDLKPCRTSGGEYGLYDTVRQRFLGKSGGSGTITGA